MDAAVLSHKSKEELISLLLTMQTKFSALETRLNWFQNQIFGAKSEKRIPPNADQLNLGDLLEKPQEPVAEQKEKITYERTKRQKGVLPGAVDSSGLSFDERAQVKEVNVPNPDLKGLVEGKDYEVIGSKTSYTLAQKPASYVVLKFVQQTVKLKESKEFKQKTIKPLGVLEGSYADVSLVANILIDKIRYHLPLYRQHQRIAASGIKIARSSLINYFDRASDLLEPIYRAQLDSMRESKVLAMDESPIKAGRAKNKMKKGYFWVMYGDKQEVLFYYSPSRGSPVIEEILGDQFSGTLLTDGYEAYAKYCSSLESVVHAECWSHTRRKFLKAEKMQPALVAQALEYIRKAYEIEASVKDLDLEKVVKLRGDKTKLVIDQFFEWLKGTFKTNSLLSSDLFTEAANYALKRENQLRVFLDNPDVQIDTNHLEREIRPVAIGRKNWMFCFSEVGAKNAAIVFSLIASCKLHQVDPYDYLVDVMQRVSDVKQKDIALLTPRLWKQNFNHRRNASVLDFDPNN